MSQCVGVSKQIMSSCQEHHLGPSNLNTCPAITIGHIRSGGRLMQHTWLISCLQARLHRQTSDDLPPKTAPDTADLVSQPEHLNTLPACLVILLLPRKSRLRICFEVLSCAFASKGFVTVASQTQNCEDGGSGMAAVPSEELVAISASTI